jgi:hypothetical protein
MPNISNDTYAAIVAAVPTAVAPLCYGAKGHPVGFLPCRPLANPPILAGMAKAYRIIYALTMQLEGGWTATFPLDRRGQAVPRRANDVKNGRPHWPKKRTVDLQVGDQVFFRGCWRDSSGAGWLARRILGKGMSRCRIYLSAEEAAVVA